MELDTSLGPPLVSFPDRPKLGWAGVALGIALGLAGALIGLLLVVEPPRASSDLW